MQERQRKALWSAIISIPILELFRMGVLSIPYARQGFFCQDDAIRYPLYEDTITSETMFVIFFIVSVCLVVSVEYALIKHLTRAQRRQLIQEKGAIHPGLLNCAHIYLSLSCSVLANSAIVNLGKRTALRLRPNFLAVCKPNLTELCPPDTYRYVEDYVCYGKDREDEYFSFPSGHAAHAANFGVFLIFYLQKRCKFQDPLKPFLQFVIFLFSFFVCLSRVRDHKHRLSDVCGGAVIGAMTGLFFMNFVIRNFRINRYITSEEYVPIATTLVPTAVIHENSITKAKPVTSEYGSVNSSSSENIFEKCSSSQIKS
ncbi:PAP2 superfamily domain-containing protein [Ditylenchus destructor]|uniref:PAP2 superfamily domain-containing protein n=1 Tax=Ditylenchus destructor TaxID=166010 RepID=A0AAD4R4X7_9BILA|nr:PAP2 superfamily domain-containing protein [Ditylenchus destructor]